ncbi:hypothetical protein GCM10009718_32850 [Isoptericola halotolerans]|uniref:Uncharacterized protein n=1 Tax=Isoptericola halotolerans TaxID=300560 RepID=A0ABX2A939_9MICO|nr:hypothetical protein [Isoptericola halotolerans]NOV98173.1 hypothetical protein [Isoptericola halotolerans]
MDVAAFVVSVVALGVAAFALRYAHVEADAARRSVELQEEAAARYRAPWALRLLADESYELVNDGDESVFDVEITPPARAVVHGQRTVDRLAPGSSMSFFVATSLATDGRVISATWSRRPGGDTHEWQRQLPTGS